MRDDNGKFIYCYSIEWFSEEKRYHSFMSMGNKKQMVENCKITEFTSRRRSSEHKLYDFDIDVIADGEKAILRFSYVDMRI